MRVSCTAAVAAAVLLCRLSVSGDASRLRTKADWIEAGKLVFRSHIQYSPAPEGPLEVGAIVPVQSDGTVLSFRPGHQYYIRRKGVIEIGINACADCHTRIMPDGSFLERAQGIAPRPFSDAVLKQVRESEPLAFAARAENDWQLLAFRGYGARPIS